MTTATDMASNGGFEEYEGERVRRARDRLGFSQYDLAEAMGIGHATLSKLEGSSDPLPKKYRNLIALAMPGITAHWLETGELNRHSGPSGEGLPGDDVTVRRLRRVMKPAILPPRLSLVA